MSCLSKKIERLMNFKGAMVAALTPFDDKGEINVSMINDYVKYLASIGVVGAYIIGTTGEGYNLTNDERLSIAKAWRKAIDDQNVDMLTIFNVTSLCLKESVQLSKQVESIGLDAIAVLPPLYYKPQCVEDMVNYFKLFATAAPNTPLVYYHIPYMTGELKFDFIELIGEGLKQIPQFAGMKYTDNNIVRFSILQKNFKNNFKIFTGFDEVLLPALTSVECNAGICALFNLPENVRSYKEMMESVENSDLTKAREQHNKIIDQCIKYKGQGFVPRIKAAFNSNVKSLNIDFGYSRPPCYYHFNF